MIMISIRTIAVILFITVTFTGCGLSTKDKSDVPAEKLPDVQITDYNGKKLSSIDDVKDVSIKGPQNINIETYRLTVNGLVDNPSDFTYDQVLENKRYSKAVTLNCVIGWSADILWEGVALKDLFDKVKIKSDANTVIFHAADDYTTSLPLKFIQDRNIIMAYKMNGIVLPAKHGFPFMLVAEDKFGYKWIKWITRIELSGNSEYKGYWESAGFSNEANVKN